jgi:cell wall-associated NlpC family hydrolase
MDENRTDNFALYKEAASWLNTPHVEGGLSHKGIDCSGLVYVIYKNVYEKTIERNSETILKRNCDKIGRARLRAGDLVFFNTTGLNRLIINHVGIYLRDAKFIHTSLSKGVMISSLDENYYRKTWVCGGRVKYYK